MERLYFFLIALFSLKVYKLHNCMLDFIVCSLKKNSEICCLLKTQYFIVKCKQIAGTKIYRLKVKTL